MSQLCAYDLTMTSLGLALLVVGAMVALVEAHQPTHGIAGGLGVAAVAIGAVLLISGLGAGVLIALLSGALVASTGAGAVVWTVRKGVSARHRRVRTGAEGLIGQIGVVRSWENGGGSVALGGALWHARRSLGVADLTADLTVADLTDVTDRGSEPGGDDATQGPDAMTTGGPHELHAGDPVVVERVSGLTLSVRPAEEWELL